MTLKIVPDFAKVLVMGADPASWPSLLAVTIAQRLYVFTFLTVFLLLAGRDLGWRRAAGRAAGCGRWRDRGNRQVISA